ncbi:hypothetical protein Tco_1428534 [Tanacetum coccineum]
MSKVASRPSSSSEFPIAHVTTLPEIRQRSAILIRPGEAIPFGRPYRTHLNRPRKLLTTRKRVGPLPARRLAWRRGSPHSSDHRPSSSSSSSNSSPVHSSSLDAPDQAHYGSSTRDVPPRLCYPPRRAPRRSEAFRRWCAAPLSTLYQPTTSESSSGDSSERPLHSSSHSAGPSRKRCRSPVDYKRDSYSSEASIKEDTEVDPIETEVDMELGIGDGDDVRNHVKINPRDVRDDTEEYGADTSARDTVEVGIDPMLFEDMPIDLDDVVRDFYHHMSEVRIDRIVGIETVQRRLEVDQLIARGERAGMIERIESLRLENLKVRAMLDIKRDRVNSLQLQMSLSQEEFRQVRRDRDDTRWRLRRLESNYGVTCEDEAKRRNSGAKTKTFEENYYLLPYAVSSKEDTAYQRQLITSIRVRSIPDSAYHSSPIRRIAIATPDLNGTHTTPCLSNLNLVELKTNNNVKIEISKELLMKLRNNAYNGAEANDAIDHITKFLQIVDIVKIPNVDPEQLATKNALWNFWEKRYDNDTLIDDEESSDDESDGSNHMNHQDTNPFFDPYLNDNGEDEAKRRNSRAKTKTFEEYSYLLPYAASSKEDTAYQRQLITRIRIRSIPDSAYHSLPIRRMPSWSSVKDL